MIMTVKITFYDETIFDGKWYQQMSFKSFTKKGKSFKQRHLAVKI